jgi:hypothetical protein
VRAWHGAHAAGDGDLLRGPDPDRGLGRGLRITSARARTPHRAVRRAGAGSPAARGA